MNDLYRLAVSVTKADGSIVRWGGDEPDAGKVPQGISFGTSIPGGYKDASLSLARRIDIDSPDLNLYDSIRIYGPGNQTVWEGRVAQLPRQHDQSYSVHVGAVGWSAHLRDDPSFSCIYVDRDLSGWGAPSSAKVISAYASGYRAEGPDVRVDATTGLPTLTLEHVGAYTTIKPLIHARYDSGPGNTIATIYYDYLSNANAGSFDGWYLGIASGDDGSGNQISSTFTGASATGTGYFTPTTARRFASIEFYKSAAGPALEDNRPYSVDFRNLAVYGNHGLTRQGTAPGGFYASDIIAHILSQAAPLLSYTTGTDGSIAPTTFAIPHLAFKDPITAEDAISRVNGYHLYEWAVWDNKTFYYTQPDSTQPAWEARLSDGARITLEGEDANNTFNGVFVTYTDPAGTVHTVGPPGSTAETTDSTLEDTSDTNPVNAHGIPRRWAKLDISTVTTQAAAIQLGSIWLAEHTLPQRRGQLTLTGTATHPTKGKRPVYEIRAGDWIKIPDHPSDVSRRIIETRYENDTRTLTASLDNTAWKIESIVERMGVSLVGVI